jgi:hypothetical protein
MPYIDHGCEKYMYTPPFIDILYTAQFCQNDSLMMATMVSRNMQEYI